MLGIEYVRRNISRKNWASFLAGEIFFVARLLISLFIPLAQKKMIDAASIDQLDFFDAKSITCLCLALGLGLVFIVYIRLTCNASGTAFASMVTRNFERMFAHRHSSKNRKDSSWCSTIILDETLRQTLDSSYTLAFFSIIQFVVILVIVGSWNISLVYIILAVDLVYLSLVVLLSKKRKTASELGNKGFLTLGPAVNEGLESMRTYRRFGDQNVLFSRLQSQFDYVTKYNTQSRIAVSTSNSLREISFSIIMICMIVASVGKISDGSMSTGSLVTVIAFIPQLLLPVRAVGDIFMMEAWATPMKEIYLKEQKEYESDIPAKISLPDLESAETFSMAEIGFSYKEGAAIENISLRCEKGSATALLGLSGEGKSTIIRLMTGEEKPLAGQVLFCGAPMAELPDPLQYAFINSYDQDTEILNADVLENILVGKELVPAASVEATKKLLTDQFQTCVDILNDCIAVTERDKPQRASARLFRELGKKQHEKLRCILGLPLASRLQAEQEVGLVLGLLCTYPAEKIAATLAEAEFGRSYCVKETVDALIKITGIEHLTGRTLGEGGAGISGGERQRIALARCLAKESWKLLIVDEPFTSLDALAEDELSQVLRAYTRGNSDTGDARGNRDPCDNRGKTLLLVTHKLNLVPLLTDHVILLDQGGVAAQGTHAELLDDSELYASLWKAFSAQRA